MSKRLRDWCELIGWLAVAALLLWGMATPARGDEPAFSVVVGEAPPQLHPVELKPLVPIVVPAGASFGWVVEPEPEEWVESTPLVCKFRGKARVYEVQAFLFANGRFTRVPKLASQKVVVGNPQPDPGPKPPPIDPPTPNTAAAAFVVVEETANAADYRRGEFFADAALRATIAAANLKYQIVDKDVLGPDGQPPAHLKNYLAKAAGKALPQLFIVDAKGKALFSGDLPPTPAEFVALLKKLGVK